MPPPSSDSLALSPAPVPLRWWQRFLVWERSPVSLAGLSLLDQAVVSATNFLATILIGRYCGPQDLGVYSLVFTLMVLVTCVHQSLLMTPYTVFVHRLSGSAQTTYSGSVFLQHASLSFVATLMLLIAAVVFRSGGGLTELAIPTGMLAMAVPFVLIREFGRRHSFAHLLLPRAIAIDIAASTLQIVAMMLLIGSGRLGATSTMLVVGMSYGAVGLSWALLTRREFTFDRSQLLPHLHQNLRCGRWIFASQVTFLIQSYLIHWLLAFGQDTAATGILAACTTIVMLSNPFIQGVGNILNPRIAKAYAEDRELGLRRIVVRATVVLGTTMGLFYLLVHFGGAQLMELFYGDQYTGHDATLRVLAAGALVSSLTMSMLHGLWTMEMPQLAFAASVIGLLATLLCGICWAGPHGPLGAAWAMIIGNVTASATLAIAFRWCLGRRREVEIDPRA